MAWEGKIDDTKIPNKTLNVVKILLVHIFKYLSFCTSTKVVLKKL